MHSAFIHCHNFFSLSLRFLTDSYKMFELFTVVTFISLCLSELRLIKLTYTLFLLHSWLLLIVLLNHIKIHWIFFVSWGKSFFSHSQSSIRICLLHLSFSLLTVNVNEDIYHVLKFLRVFFLSYLIFNSLIEFSVVLQY